MKSKKLFDALGDIDDRYLDMVDVSEKENHNMSKKHISTRKAVTFLIAAVISVSILAVTAMAAGWIPNIFATLKDEYPSEKELFQAAAEANVSAEPIAVPVEVPEVDGSKLTLYEKYYNGETILLGYDLNEILPAPVVGIIPEESILQDMKSIPGSYAFTYNDDGDDSVEHLLAVQPVQRRQAMRKP